MPEPSSSAALSSAPSASFPTDVPAATSAPKAPLTPGETRVGFGSHMRAIMQFASEQRAWLWLLIPYAFAWIVPAQWSRNEWGNPNHSFSFEPFVPFLAALIAWSERDQIAAQKAKILRKLKARDWRRKNSPIVLVLGLALFLFSHIVQVKGIIVMSLWLIAVGTIWCVYDALTVFLLWKPLLFGLLAIPPPDSIIDNAAHRFQVLSVNIAGALLHKTHLASDAVAANWNLTVKGATMQISTACSGVNTVLPLLVFLTCYLLCTRPPALRATLLFLLTGIVGFGANIARIMAIGLISPTSSGMAQTLNTINTYLIIVPLLLVIIALDRKTTNRKIETERLTGGTLRVAHGTGVAVSYVFKPLDWLMSGLGGLWKLFKKSERGLEKGLSRLMPKKKKRNRW